MAVEFEPGFSFDAGQEAAPPQAPWDMTGKLLSMQLHQPAVAALLTAVFSSLLQASFMTVRKIVLGPAWTPSFSAGYRQNASAVVRYSLQRCAQLAPKLSRSWACTSHPLAGLPAWAGTCP